MKRNQLIQHLENHGCIFKREGSSHSIYMNSKTRKRTAVPRHTEIKNTLCNDICKQLDVPKIN